MTNDDREKANILGKWNDDRAKANILGKRETMIERKPTS